MIDNTEYTLRGNRMFHVPECSRITSGPLRGSPALGNNGAFAVHVNGLKFFAIASDGAGWEHVSVSLPDREPTWEEMCAIKAMFWHEEDAVFQFHPSQSQYVNVHKYCLHLWRPIDQDIPVPPAFLVGPK